MTQSRVARASLWAIAGGTSQYFITFLLLVYLARVLEPRDFGLMATVTIGLDLGMQVARWGQVELLQQERYRNDEARNQALRMSLALAILFALGFVIAANPLARYFESPELATMMFMCAPVFIFSALSATAEGILRGDFRFRTLAYRGTVCAVIGGVFAVGLAAMSYGALALAAQRLVQAVITVVWVWSAIDWRPSLQIRPMFQRGLVKDGASVTTGTLLPLIVPRSIDLFVGVFMGPAQLGLLRIAFRIFEFLGQLVVIPLVGVAHAQLAAVAGDAASLRQSYLRFTQVSASFLCPLMIGFAIVAPHAVPLLFGEKWVSCVPLVQMVSILALSAPPNYFFPSAMIALGHSRAVLHQGIFQVIVGLVLAAIAAQYSLTAVILSQIIRGLLLTGYNFFDMRRYAGLSLAQTGRSMAPPYVATIIMAGVMIGVGSVLPDRFAPYVVLILLTGVGGLAYGAVLVVGVRLGIWPDYFKAFSRIMPERLRRFIPT